MTLSVKFGGALVRFKPKDCLGNTTSIAEVKGLTLAALLVNLGIPEEQRLLVILNSTVVATDDYHSTVLADGDDLSLMPPIQAG